MNKAFVLVLPVLVTACTVTSIGRQEIVSGETTRLVAAGMNGDEVQVILGAQPSKIEFQDDRVIWHYYRIDGFSLGVGLINFLDGDVRSIAIVFDPEGQVERVEGMPIPQEELDQSPQSLFNRLHRTRRHDRKEFQKTQKQLRDIGIEIRYLDEE